MEQADIVNMLQEYLSYLVDKLFSIQKLFFSDRLSTCISLAVETLFPK